MLLVFCMEVFKLVWAQCRRVLCMVVLRISLICEQRGGVTHQDKKNLCTFSYALKLRQLGNLLLFIHLL